MERCLASEGELEKLRDKTNDMRRKLDDAQAALHELGRENQSLQVSHNVHHHTIHEINYCCISAIVKGPFIINPHTNMKKNLHF